MRKRDTISDAKGFGRCAVDCESVTGSDSRRDIEDESITRPNATAGVLRLRGLSRYAINHRKG